MAKKLNEVIKLALLIADCPIDSISSEKKQSENLVQALATLSLRVTETLVEAVSRPTKINSTKQFNPSGKKQSQNKISKSASRPTEYKANYRDWDEYRWKKPNNTFRSQVVGSTRQQKSGNSSFKHSWQQVKNPQLGARDIGLMTKRSLRRESVLQVSGAEC